MTSLDPEAYAHRATSDWREEVSAKIRRGQDPFEVYLDAATQAIGAATGSNACGCYRVSAIFHAFSDEMLEAAHVEMEKRSAPHVSKDS